MYSRLSIGRNTLTSLRILNEEKFASSMRMAGFINVIFEFNYKPYTPRRLITLDVSLKMAKAFDGSEVGRNRSRVIDVASKMN
jgi:hypothetical protein